MMMKYAAWEDLSMSTETSIIYINFSYMGDWNHGKFNGKGYYIHADGSS